ncbi:MAG: GDSL-type esterase/lipase family protein [Candidatus Bathyarchaeota archaeon]|nr:GDSL-type esterase/lipase family protein [Candidatus Bathyarchaeota archaeon]
MKRRTVLLAAAVAIIIVSAGVTTVVLQTLKDDGLSSKIRVACVGDSITKGTFYPSDLSRLLGTNYTVRNFGVGGATVSLSAGKPYMNQPEFEDAKAFQPNIVIIMLGANDALPSHHNYNATFIPDYIKLIEAFEALASKPQIWIVKPPPIFNNGTGLSTQFFEQTILPDIEAVANHTHLPLIDVYSALVAYPNYFPDGVHPNPTGAQLIADVVYSAITQNNLP